MNIIKTEGPKNWGVKPNKLTIRRLFGYKKWYVCLEWIGPLVSFLLKYLVWQQTKKRRKTERPSDLPLLICGGECLEWSEGSERRSGERERLLLFRSWDRLEWSEATEWLSEISNKKIKWLHTLQVLCYRVLSEPEVLLLELHILL